MPTSKRKVWKTVVRMSGGEWTLYLVTTDEAVRHEERSRTSRVRAYPYEYLGAQGSHNPHRDLALGLFHAYLASCHGAKKLLVQEMDFLPPGLKPVPMGIPGDESFFCLFLEDSTFPPWGQI